jgi:hypothetical protein
MGMTAKKLRERRQFCLRRRKGTRSTVECAPVTGVRDNRENERRERRAPPPSIVVIGEREFGQPIATGETHRQFVNEMKTRDDERRHEKQKAAAKDDKRNFHPMRGLWITHQP